MRTATATFMILALALLAACGDDDATPTTTPTPTATATPTPTATTTPAVSDCDARGFGGLSVGDVVEDPFVCIEAPLPGESLAGAIVVSGWSAGAFEASLVVEVLDGDGSILSRLPTTVAQPDIGLFAGEFAITMPMEDAPRFDTGAVHVWAESPRDGSIAFDTTVEVAFCAVAPPRSVLRSTRLGGRA